MTSSDAFRYLLRWVERASLALEQVGMNPTAQVFCLAVVLLLIVMICLSGRRGKVE